MTARSLRAARASFAAAATFVVLFAVLHVIKPELDPSWRMGSEYAIGDYGWVMRIAMCALALSCAASFAALRPEIETTGGRIGSACFLLTPRLWSSAALFVCGSHHDKAGRHDDARNTSWCGRSDIHFRPPSRRCASQPKSWTPPDMAVRNAGDSMDSPLHVDKRRDDVGPYHHGTFERPRFRSRLAERMAEPPDGAELLRLANDRLMAGNSMA